MWMFWCITAWFGSHVVGVVPGWSHALHEETPQVGKPSGTGGRSVWLPTCTTMDIPICWEKCVKVKHTSSR
jgi:hypothetical protein